MVYVCRYKNTNTPKPHNRNTHPQAHTLHTMNSHMHNISKYVFVHFRALHLFIHSNGRCPEAETCNNSNRQRVWKFYEVHTHDIGWQLWISFVFYLLSLLDCNLCRITFSGKLFYTYSKRVLPFFWYEWIFFVTVVSRPPARQHDMGPARVGFFGQLYSIKRNWGQINITAEYNNIMNAF